MKTVGIIGGIGPESTIDYYRSIIAAYQERKQDGSYPAIIINSVDLKKLVDFVTANKLAEMTDYLADEVQKLALAGADFGLLAANTPHIVFNDVLRRSSIPLLSIVQATCAAARELGLKRLGLFGTRFTAQAGFYQDAFASEGMTLVLPDRGEQDYIHDKYMNELVKGIFLSETRERLLTIVERLKKHESIEALILGGTELPLILREAEMKSAGIPFLDTTQIHVKSVIAQLLS
ncbi:MAG: aspartate racemase [Acidobacteriota bacterium]|jgi:aspartate racemase|nr:aspartate racemase [Acidobacteriota bacterium]